MLRVGIKLRRKFEGLAYENAENQYPRLTIRPKIDPLAYKVVHTPNSKSLTEALLLMSWLHLK